MAGNLIIKKATQEELTSVLEYIQEKYLQNFGTVPNLLSDDCFVALDDNRLYGAICVSVTEIAEIKRIFQLDFSILPGLEREYISFGRWVSDRRGVGALLAKTAFAWSLKENKSRCLSCGKPNIINYLRYQYKFKMDSFMVPILPPAIKPEHRNFYLLGPSPGLYVGQLESWYHCLTKLTLPAADIRV